MRDSVPNARYSSFCNVLRQWSISLIPTYSVYQLYDISSCIYISLAVLVSPGVPIYLQLYLRISLAVLVYLWLYLYISGCTYIFPAVLIYLRLYLYISGCTYISPAVCDHYSGLIKICDHYSLLIFCFTQF